MLCDRCNYYFSFRAIFCSFTTLTCPKNENLKKWKKYLEMSFYLSVPKIMIICYTVPGIVHDGYNCHFSFWAISYPFTLLTAQKIKISKKWKKHLEISSFYTCLPKIMIKWCTVPKEWCAMDGRTDRQTEKVTRKGGCPT